MRTLIFGDSIVQGFFDSKGGWANRIMVHYQEEALKDLNGDWNEVFVLGISGDTVEGVLARIKQETLARRLSEDEECIVLAVGINDARHNENIVAIDVHEFQELYLSLIDAALELCPRVICVGLSSVNENETDPWQYSSTGKQWKNNHINLFEDTIKQAAMMKKVPFVPIHDEFLRISKQANILADGLHPNDEGHSFIAKNVFEAIEVLILPDTQSKI